MTLHIIIIQKICIFRNSKQAWVFDRSFTPLPSDLDTRGRKDVFYGIDPNRLDSIYNQKLLQHKNSSFIGAILSERITLATQFSLFPPYASDEMQISNYGLGGHYGIHFDAIYNDKYINKNTGILLLTRLYSSRLYAITYQHF